MARDDEDRGQRPEIDLKTSRRLIRFVNAARRPQDLMIAPDQIEIRHETLERDHLPEPAEREPLFDRELAERIIEARDNVGPVHGFLELDQLLRVDRRLDRLRDIVWRFGPAVYGRWDLLYDMEAGDVEVESEHAALLHTYEVIFLASGTDTFLWDPTDEATPRFRQLQAADTGLAANLMCSGHSFLSDGKLLAVGGGGAGPGQPTSIQAWKFDPVAETWQKTAGDMTIKRWYPTVVTLGDEFGSTGSSGRVLVASGDLNATTPTPIEVYSEASDTFEPPVTVAGAINQKFPQTYPGLHLLPGGEIFYAPVGFGDCSTSSVYSLSDPAAYFTFAGSTSGSWTNVGSAMNRTKGMSIQLLQPTYPYVRVMVVGGGDSATSKTVQLANLSTLSPSWGSPISIPDSEPRVNANAVVLPDESVFISGGTQTASPASWIYEPSAMVSPWSEMDELNVPRHYHSMALLLPSGKVMAAGGAAPGGCSHSMNNSIEVFSPPYLFNSDGSPADRPQIAKVNGDVPTKKHKPTVHHGSAFTIETPEAADIDRVVLVRPMAVTHQTDTEQRVVRCSFSKTADDTITASAPNGSHPHSVAPRGYYMLFVLNAQGVPSEGKFVHLH
jgi:hypothetical protein